MMAGGIDFLVRRVRGGETKSFAAVIRRFEQPVWLIVAAMLQDFDRSAAIGREMMQNGICGSRNAARHAAIICPKTW